MKRLIRFAPLAALLAAAALAGPALRGPAGASAPSVTARPPALSPGAQSAPSASAETGRRRVPRPARADTARVTVDPRGTQAFVAYPAGAEGAPGVVIVHEWWGVNAQIRELARRLAKQGYVAIVPDLYAGRVASDTETAHILARGLDEDEALEKIAAAGRWLESDPRSAGRRRAVMGFCMGGRLALFAAIGDPEVSAVVMFYGAPELRAERLAPLRAPLLGHFGADDQGISVDRVEAFERTLKGAGKEAEVHVYAGAGHAFMNDEQPGYRPDAARLAWVRTLDFLQKHAKVRR